MTDEYDKPAQKWVPYKVICKCGTVIARGSRLHTGGFMFPSETTEFMLCNSCEGKLETSHA